MTYTPPTTYAYALTYPEPALHKDGCQHITRNPGFEIGHVEKIVAQDVAQAKRFAAVDYAEALDHFDGRYAVQQADGTWLVDKVAAYEEAIGGIDVYPCTSTAREAGGTT